jgi:ABC-type transport system involved in multi-copper enzyme maturation permease subunit
LLTAVGAVAAAAVYLLVTGVQMRHAYAGALTTCTSQHNCSVVPPQFPCTSQDGCSVVIDLFQGSYIHILTIIQLLFIVAPGLIGVFWGAPLIARELETGTDQLAWTQSVTRARWLAVKLIGVGAASVVTIGLLSSLLTWWAGPLDQITGNRFAAMTFATRDVVPLGYAALAFALGVAVGLLLRRTIPAMVVTLTVFVGILVLMPTSVGPNLLPSTTVTFAVDRATVRHANGIFTGGGGSDIYISGLPTPMGAWILSTPPVVDALGQPVPAYAHLNCFQGSSATKGGGIDAAETAACLARFNLHESITYQPASHYWQLQWYETGIFLALAAMLSGACFWGIRRLKR